VLFQRHKDRGPADAADLDDLSARLPNDAARVVGPKVLPDNLRGTTPPEGTQPMAVMDWFIRRVLSWRLSITMETDLCVEALTEAMDWYDQPGIFNTDQDVQFTSAALIDELSDRGVRISMDGEGWYLDNIFIERLWRSLKYEEVHIRVYDSVAEARWSLGVWLAFYHGVRPHQSFEYRTPREIFEVVACEHVDSTSASLRDAPMLPTCSQAHRQEKEVIMY